MASRDHFQSSYAANQELENPLVYLRGTALDSSGSSSGPSEFSEDGWESDRSWHLRYGQ